MHRLCYVIIDDNGIIYGVYKYLKDARIRLREVDAHTVGAVIEKHSLRS